MPADEPTRFRLHRRLSELLDPELADAMMESMPPMPWNELATKDDLRDLEQRIDERFDVQTKEITAGMVALEGRLAMKWMESTRVLLLAMFTLFLGTAGLFVGLAF